MLEIFHVPRSRSLRLIWLAEEMGVPYALKAETFGKPSEAFLAANPTGALPAMVDGEVAMGESVAIMMYIIERYGPTPLARRLGDPTFPAYLQFMVFGEGSLAAFLNPIIATRFLAPEDQRENFTVQAARGLFDGRIKALAQQLQSAPYVAGEFSAADISVGYALALGDMLGLGQTYPAAVADYFTRLKSRPAYQRAAAA